MVVKQVTGLDQENKTTEREIKLIFQQINEKPSDLRRAFRLCNSFVMFLHIKKG